MAAKIPATFKAVVPFIRRAEELDKDQSRAESALIAYHCRQYAMELGIKLRENDPSDEATEFLLNLMDTLEAEKKKLPAFTQEEGKQICEEFAMEIFGKADDEDRAGNADKNTARTFYAAGTFLDILSQFGEVSDDVLEKRKYCKFKAASILKAIKEGRRPTPGPPDSGENEQVRECQTAGHGIDRTKVDRVYEQETSDGSSDVPSMSSLTISAPPQAPSAPLSPVSMAPPMAPNPPMAPSSPPSYNNTPTLPNAPTEDISEQRTGSMPSNSNSFTAAPQNAYTPVNMQPPAPNQYANQSSYNSFGPASASPRAPSSPAPARPAYAGGMGINAGGAGGGSAYRGNVGQDQISDAIECSKFAIAALKVKDINLARQRLEMALQCLR